MTDRIRVLILTTRSVVTIQQIRKEMNGIPSLMCIDGDSEKTGVSRNYRDFVARGSGVIARAVGHDSFRMDVDRKIDDGNSFQFPVYLAHILEHRGELAQTTDAAPPAACWFATGRVDHHDLRVKPVRDIDRKLRVLHAWLGNEPKPLPTRLRLLLPAGAEDEAAEMLPALRAFGVDVSFVSHADEPLAAPPITASPIAALPLTAPPVAEASVMEPPINPPSPVLGQSRIRSAMDVGTLTLDRPRPAGVSRRTAGFAVVALVAVAALVSLLAFAPVEWSRWVRGGEAATAILAVIRSPTGQCYGGERQTSDYQTAGARQIDVPHAAGRICRAEVTSGSAQAFLIRSNGHSLAPVPLGLRGSLTDWLPEADRLAEFEVVFASDAARIAEDEGKLPRLVIRFLPPDQSNAPTR